MIRRLSTALAWCGMLSATCAGDWPGYGGATSNHHVSVQSAETWTPGLGWSVELGRGRSGIVVEGETAFVSYLEPFNQADSELPVAERLHRESVVAM
ncbi:MAG: hypothetical protein AAFX06_12320, partial [Planctomycetota bacterium]